MPQYYKMPNPGSGPGALGALKKFSIRLAGSYALDWIVLIAVAAVAAVLGNIAPNKRPFSLSDPNISFPFTEHEIVPPWLLLVLNAGVPIVCIAIVALIFIPGATVPKGTPQALVWKRKLWELHVGLLGLALSLVSAWFFTQGMKNLFGRPRPDMLSRCEPDFQHAARFVVGGFQSERATGQLYSANICQQKDSHKLDDGFRSYPSGHSSSAAAGLTYLSLFLASKFSVTIPFVVPGSGPRGDTSYSAFPSRMRPAVDSYEPTRTGSAANEYSSTSPMTGKVVDRNAQHNESIQALRLQAAAPPLYLLAIVIIPFAVAVFVAGSRWCDFRHHAFDILFGFTMGLITAIYAFRYYHLPIQVGAGWAWGPRSEDRAFWAGVGRLGYAGKDVNYADHIRANDLGESGDADYRTNSHDADLTQRTGSNEYKNNNGPQAYGGGRANYGPPNQTDYGAEDTAYRGNRDFQSVELQRMA